MSTKELESLEQQRQRRKRINRMKTCIIMTIAGWMVLSFLAIIILIVQVIGLNQKVRKLEELSQGVTEQSESEISESQETEETEDATEDTEAQTDASDMLTGIDTPENMAQEGDVHQVYLTFDGGPNENTNDILDILAQYNVKATFFVVGNETEEMKEVYKRIVDEGHTLGMRSYANTYSSIYASEAAFTEDLNKLSDYLEEVTGKESIYYRFPGGSSNPLSNVEMEELVRILNDEQITYFDWNVSAGDAANDYTADEVVDNVITGVSKYKTSVVLMHDGAGKSETVAALGTLIEQLQSMNAQILPIDENTNVIQYIKAESVE